MTGGGEVLTARSPAKINLTLRVGPRRSDGYHDIESLVALLDFADEVDVQPRQDGALSVECDTPGIPCDETNLALRAAHALRESAGAGASRGDPSRGAHVVLRKRVPAGAGLGGGSSNAAATLMLLNRLWKLGGSAAQLGAIGATIGSDVPLFFHGPLAIIRGRGEIVQPVRAALVGAVVLAIPPIHSATAAVYAAFDTAALPPPRESAADLVMRLSRVNASFPAGPPQLPAAALAAALFNDLESAALTANADLARFAGALRAATGEPFHMTGSGSAFFHICDKYTDRRRLNDLAAAIESCWQGARGVITYLA